MMNKMIVDLSKNINDSNRVRIIPLTEGELEERRIIREEATIEKEANAELIKKRNELVTDIATTLGVDRDKLAELFRVPDESAIISPNP